MTLSSSSAKMVFAGRGYYRKQVLLEEKQMATASLTQNNSAIALTYWLLAGEENITIRSSKSS